MQSIQLVTLKYWLPTTGLSYHNYNNLTIRLVVHINHHKPSYYQHILTIIETHLRWCPLLDQSCTK